MGKVVKREKSVPGCEEYEREAVKFLNLFGEFATEQFGERCADFDADCACCKMWKLYDQTAEIVDI